ncbi:MAG: tRNA threonylcarbamoyladenosine dehydratase [Clostridia bacterium]|nr:tRNA threonylcarbamoyladenosine dehydratase [Clostridia bacterium]
MRKQFSRSAMVIGEKALEKLSSSRIAIFGIGGVGGYTLEALVRSGVGEFDLIDNDTVNITNINRQIIALHNTVGQYKVDVARERILSINPAAKVNVYKLFFLPENSAELDFTKYSYVVDCVDTVTAKLEIIERAKNANVPVISCMGTGNKLDPTLFEVSDIYKTSVCPLAKVMRRELKKRNVNSLKVLYSKEEPIKPLQQEDLMKRPVPGSVSFVPSVAGLIIAGEVIKDLISK